MIDIKEKRKQAGLTQVQLADKVGVTVQAVSQWEQGKTLPAQDNIARLAEALGISIAELLGEQKKEYNWIVHDKLFSEEHMFTRLKVFTDSEDLPLTRKALYYAREKHEGQMRKPSLFSKEPVPYIIHPLLMACQAHAMGIRQDEVLATILLHDVCEDCGVMPEELPFPDAIKHSVALLTKNKSVPTSEYYAGLETDSTASIVKALDRCNNVSLMATAFSKEKLAEYIDETEEYVLPLMQHIKRDDQEYNDSIFLLKYQLCSTVETIKALLMRED